MVILHTTFPFQVLKTIPSPVALDLEGDDILVSTKLQTSDHSLQFPFLHLYK